MNFKKLTYLFALCPLALAGLSSCGVNGARTPGKVLTFTEARDYVKEHFSSEVDNIQERITKTLDLTMSTSGISVDGFFSFPNLEIQPTHIDFKLPAQENLTLSLSNASGASGAAYVKNSLSKIAGPTTNNNVLNKGKSAQAGDSGLEILDYAVACIANPFLTTPVLDFVNTYVSQVENIDIINQTFTLDSRNTFYYTVEIADLAKLTKIFEQYEKIFPSKLPTFIRGQDGYAYASISFDDQGFATGLDINIHSNSLKIQMPNQGSGEESTTIYDGLLDANLTATLKHHFYDPAKLHHIGVDQPTANAKYDIIAIQSEEEYSLLPHYTNGQRKLVDSWDTYKYLAPYHETLLPGFGTDVIVEAPQGSTISQEDLSINIGGRLYKLDDFLVDESGDIPYVWQFNHLVSDETGGSSGEGVIKSDSGENLTINSIHTNDPANYHLDPFSPEFYSVFSYNPNDGFSKSDTCGKLINSIVEVKSNNGHIYDLNETCKAVAEFAGEEGGGYPFNLELKNDFFKGIEGGFNLAINALPENYFVYDFTNPRTGTPIAYLAEGEIVDGEFVETSRSSYGIYEITEDMIDEGKTLYFTPAYGYYGDEIGKGPTELQKRFDEAFANQIFDVSEADKIEAKGLYTAGTPMTDTGIEDGRYYYPLMLGAKFFQELTRNFTEPYQRLRLKGFNNGAFLFNPHDNNPDSAAEHFSKYSFNWSVAKDDKTGYSPIYNNETGLQFGTHALDIDSGNLDSLTLSMDPGYAYKDFTGGDLAEWLESVVKIYNKDGQPIDFRDEAIAGYLDQLLAGIEYAPENNTITFTDVFINAYIELITDHRSSLVDLANSKIEIVAPTKVEPKGPTSIVANTIAVKPIDDRHIYLQVLPTLSDIVDADISIHINKQHN